ncbi:serine/threonine-protein phosphatase 1 regulatory subunit 10 [Anopheles stephensi]|uniref:serine/threonine-protein phosphatase 1 regulatory subunit 10 n=1 Tax=Anopheles stephensi TaxID=30069 RepID=UPI0016589465|nr:serine/threonine-protein phosphatase 1 regulatory subunit 10 [Anopheles stephensi]XP_035910983.1 serine/threonine-protein phosphatase 1 regulatory subunit 10 [Anopheles stephensi]XP_035910984.1 serine/threonine-protein phosphatase 1 regulatory subunit 10 [Anopheles stephensi]
MPRIDPMKLLVCLSVLLAPNGGIRNAGEVRRLANLMAKFSKKLVSKAIYIQILKCTETELLGQFMQTGGWSLVHTWLVDGIATKNWPLIQELMELLLCCPVDVERLKINSAPRLVKSLSTDCAHESVKVLATKLVEQWLYIVKAPKQSSPMVPLTQSELPSIAGLAADGKQQNSDGINNASKQHGSDTGNGMADSHHNGYGDQHSVNSNEAEALEEQTEGGGRENVDGGKKTFQTAGGGDLQQTTVAKKTSLVLKITTKNGKQVVAKVIKSSRKVERDAPGTNKTAGNFHDEEDAEEEAEDDEEEEDQEEVLVNIESGKSKDEAGVVARTGKDDQVDAKKAVDVPNGIDSSSSSSKERNTSSSSSKDKERHHHSHRDHREREKDRKGSSSGGGGSSSSRSSSSKSSGSSSSSKHKSSSSSSSSKSGSSSSSRSSKDKDRHTSSSNSSSSSKHKSSSSSSKSSGSSSKSSSSDKHRDSKEKSSHSTGGSSSGGSSRDSKHQSHTSRKDSRDDGAGGGSNDSGSETSSTTNTSANGTKSSKAAIIPSKKASISIEVRNPENRPKTVKTYNSQFRSHGLIEEAPPPPSRKGLKKPSSAASPAATSSSASSSTAIGSTAIGTVKRSSPTPGSGRDALLTGAPAEKKAREDPVERPGSIKLIPPKRQHALVESDMFMDALSATLRKDVKKRKRRTSGSEGAAATTTTTTTSTTATGSKPAEATTGNKPSSDAGSPTKTIAPGSPTAATVEDSASEATKPTTPTSPKVPTIAPMSFYRDTLAEQDEENGSDPAASTEEDGVKKEQEKDNESNEAEGKKLNADGTEDDDEGPIVKKPKRVKCELNEDDEEENGSTAVAEKKTTTGKKGSSDGGDDDEKTELMDTVMSEVEKKIAEEAEGEKRESSDKDEESAAADGKKPPGPGCGPDGPPGVLVIHRRKGPKKQLRWRAAEELEEVRYFELDVTERCNVTKSFTDMKQMERVDERQKFMLSRKVGSEDVMVERTPWRPLLMVDNVPPSPDGTQSLERNVQRQRERGCLQALYFNKHMIPDSPSEPDPADIYQTADPVHIPLEDVTGNPDSVNDFTSVPWPDPKSTPPHESGAFNSPFFPSDLPPAAGFGPGGFPPPFAPGAAATIGPGPWNMGPPGGAAGAGARTGGVLPPGMFPLNQPPPGMGGGGGSPNILNLPMSMSPNVPPPGMFPGAAANFNAPPPEIGLMAGGGADMGGRRGGPAGAGGVDFRNGPPPPQQWVTGNRPFTAGGNNPSRGGNASGFGNRGGGGGGGNWNNRNNNGNNGNRNNGGGDRGRMGDDGRGNYRGHWLQNNRGHNRGGGGRKW